jgi:uncharacterized protein YfaT (DUF1175 family)
LSIRVRAGLLALSSAAVIVVGLVWARPAPNSPGPVPVTIDPPVLPADGYATCAARIVSGAAAKPTITVLDNVHSASIERPVFAGDRWEVRVRAGVLPAVVHLRIDAPGYAPAFAALKVGEFAAESTAGETPSYLMLEDEADQRAFRRWFTFLAEIQYFQAPEARPVEITDCAALIRYAYREALRLHDSRWAAGAHLPLVPAMESVARYQYPYTPLGAAIFHVGGGRYAEFADAQTLQRLNSFFVTRDLTRALPGDLLFYRQDASHMPFHSMIYLGSSQVEKTGTRYVVYHTGPGDDGPGEIRRLSVAELDHFPEPEWRPAADNPAFLGVFRWNILRSHP